MSQIFIQTRGKSIDYKFLIKSPSQTWWRNYRDLTSFEAPTLIIENLDGSPRIYLSAIPSERKDRVQTRIRYTLVVEIEKGAHSLDDFDFDFILKLVSTWVNEVGQASTYSQIGNMLDNCFSEEVDRFLGLNHPEAQDIKDLNKKLEEFKNRISKLEKFKQEISNLPKPKTRDFKDASWWGGIGNEKNRQHWIALVDKLLSNNLHGKALFLNLAAEEKDLQDILRDTTTKIICLINGDLELQQFYLVEKFPTIIMGFLSKLNTLNNLRSFVVGSVCILFVFLITFNLIGFSGNRLNESEVINFVRASCPQATTATKPALTSPNSENQTTNSKPTPNSQKPKNQVIKEELATTEQLAHQLGVSENEILAEIKKCNKSFKQWSQKFKKGTWDFQISGSQLRFKKVHF